MTPEHHYGNRAPMGILDTDGPYTAEDAGPSDSRGLDPEVAAMAGILDILNKRNPEQRVRIVHWINDRFI